MKTPEQTAAEAYGNGGSIPETWRGRVIQLMAEAIEADREQRLDAEGDWADDVQNLAGCRRYTVTITGHAENNGVPEPSFDYTTDFELTEAQMRGMFAGISHTEEED